MLPDIYIYSIVDFKTSRQCIFAGAANSIATRETYASMNASRCVSPM